MNRGYCIDFDTLSKLVAAKNQNTVDHINTMINIVLSDDQHSGTQIAYNTLIKLGVLVPMDSGVGTSDDYKEEIENRVSVLEDMALGFMPELEEELLFDMPNEYIPVWNSFSTLYRHNIRLMKKVLNLKGDSAANFWKIIFN